jgi:hypothetical protein
MSGFNIQKFVRRVVPTVPSAYRKWKNSSAGGREKPTTIMFSAVESRSAAVFQTPTAGVVVRGEQVEAPDGIYDFVISSPAEMRLGACE